MAKRNLGDSGTFGTQETMDAIKKGQTERLTGIEKARSVGGKALAKGVNKSMPKVKSAQADTLQSGGIDNAGGINQGLFSGQKGLNVRRTSTGYMRK